MNESGVKKIHWSFWVITIFMLIWNIMGCVNFFVQMNPEMISSYRENEQAIIQGRPLWVTMGFAVAVFGGAIGCVILLLKKSTAVYLFIASLLGVLLATAHTLGVGIEFGPGEVFGIVLIPTIVAVFLIWYSIYAKNKGWVNT